MTNPYDIYIKTDIETASPLKQIIMLYDKAIVSLKQAVEDIKNNRIKDKVENIHKATDIILALDAALDLEKGGEIAKNLKDLYNFAYNKLLEAHAKNDTELINDIIEILETLRSAWEEIESKS
ncbi:MAG TPA: flagellar export chaperone FliS [Persephonella sp.]|uniref:Flagellar protein FliS n=1 Tax=Persephonella marina (strain DSM 14350 / EX-H1) TaxID=123214 RepID=C0QRT7_PERMH|nr:MULTISPECIES: flagellar export chaperone FliS [Persephonella]ACO04035.1 flagellar protein FliS [Persephonella marina EX-H1]HCB69128.1 flagellar export chaperone FliS [Persephonella sp.]